MWFIDKVGDIFPQPVIAARIFGVIVHALLNHCPGTASGEDESMMVKLVAVLYGIVIHLGRHAAGVDQRRGVQ